MDLESNLKELERIASILEQGNVSLEEGVKLYEQGIVLTKECMKTLDDSKKKIAGIKEEMTKLTDRIE